MFYTNDPVADFERYDAEQESALEKLPVCNCCGEPIQQERAIYYNDQWCCEDCEIDFWHGIRDDFLESVNTDG